MLTWDLKRRVFAMTLIALVSPLISTNAHADSKNETFVFTLENDVFTGSDSNYTNGLAFTWSTDDLSKYEAGSIVNSVARTLDFAPGFDADGDDNYLVFSLIHDINTPTDITIADPPLTEQPYSGVALANISTYSRRDSSATTWNVRAGAVGPISQADHVQIEFHELIGADEPLGWDTQIPNEFIFNIGYSRAQDLASGEFENGAAWRLRSVGSAELGTLATTLGAGAFFEVGRNIDDNISLTSLGAGFGSFVGVGAEPTTELEISAYTGIAGYAIGHYLPLDGTVFRDSRSIADRDDFAGQVVFGLSARYGKIIGSFGVTFAGTPSQRSETLDAGAISIGYIF